MPVNPLNILLDQPSIAQRSAYVDKGLIIHYRHDLPGALDVSKELSHHLLTFFLSENERQTTHINECGEYDGQMRKGDFYLCPAGISGFTRWQSKDETLHFVIEPDFLSRVAIDTKCVNPSSFELLPVLKVRDRSLDNLVQLFLTEINNSDLGEKLYLESLSSILGIHLLRQYCNVMPKFRQYSAGLAHSKLSKVLDYIQADLNRDLSLDSMAAQIDMSRCYFATQFKQAMGIAPHQYVSQQRVEKAKRFLRSQKLSIVDVALECGFASQSHLTKAFKKHLGTTPKAYQEHL